MISENDVLKYRNLSKSALSGLIEENAHKLINSKPNIQLREDISNELITQLAAAIRFQGGRIEIADTNVADFLREFLDLMKSPEQNSKVVSIWEDIDGDVF